MNIEKMTEMFAVSLEEKLNSEVVKKHIDECTTKMITKAIDDCFNSWSPLAKKVKTSLEEQFDSNSRFDGVDNFKNVVESKIIEQLQQLNDSHLKEKAEKLVHEVSKKTPKELDFETIAKEYLDELCDENEIRIEPSMQDWGDNSWDIGKYTINLFSDNSIYTVSGGNLHKPFYQLNDFEKFLYCLKENRSKITGYLEEETFMFGEDGYRYED